MAILDNRTVPGCTINGKELRKSGARIALSSQRAGQLSETDGGTGIWYDERESRESSRESAVAGRI